MIKVAVVALFLNHQWGHTPNRCQVLVFFLCLLGNLLGKFASFWRGSFLHSELHLFTLASVRLILGWGRLAVKSFDELIKPCHVVTHSDSLTHYLWDLLQRSLFVGRCIRRSAHLIFAIFVGLLCHDSLKRLAIQVEHVVALSFMFYAALEQLDTIS